MAGARSAARRARARRRRHARQDHHLEHAGVDPRARRARAGVPDRRRARQFLGQRAARRPEVLRHRGRRIRHGVLRQARQVRALPLAHADPQQSRIRSRRHLRKPRRRSRSSSITWCAPSRARAASSGMPATRTSQADARDGRVDAARRVSRARPAADVAWSLDVEEGGDFSKFVVLEGGKPARHGASGPC